MEKPATPALHAEFARRMFVAIIDEPQKHGKPFPGIGRLAARVRWDAVAVRVLWIVGRVRVAGTQPV